MFCITDQDCTNTPAPTNGAISPTDTIIAGGSTVTYSCTSGYTLIGSTTATCNAGAFDNTAPTCSKCNSINM